MGKHEVGTPKYIANKIKAKGLQKLRWYCQMCQKQCRDENGFKCHTMSESHHRQLLLFADNANKYMDQFSRDFSDSYLYILKRQFGTRRVAANRVYQEYISDRNHVHMNSTIWLSLTAYVKWLGRKGKCIVDETEKGWFITYIDRDPETLAALEKKAKKEKMDKDDQERTQDFIEQQVKKGRQQSTIDSETSITPLMREDDHPLILDMKIKPKFKLMGPPLCLPPTNSIKKQIKEEPIDSMDESYESDHQTNSKRKNDHEDSYHSKKFKVEKNARGNTPTESEGWLHAGIVVKIITKTLGQKYYKAKGVVQNVLESEFVGKVKLTSPEDVEGHVIKIDQEHLETVIPAIGKEILILKGKHRGCRATVERVRIEEFCLDVETEDKKLLKKLPYESICKYIG